MNSIKFSYPFPKLYGEDGRPITRCRLLLVQPIELSDLPAELIAYDTAQGAYPLPKKGSYLLLLFLKPGSIHTFTTLRRNTPEKERYYRSQVGEVFHLLLTEQPANTVGVT